MSLDSVLTRPSSIAHTADVAPPSGCMSMAPHAGVCGGASVCLPWRTPTPLGDQQRGMSSWYARRAMSHLPPRHLARCVQLSSTHSPLVIQRPDHVPTANVGNAFPGGQMTKLHDVVWAHAHTDGIPPSPSLRYRRYPHRPPILLAGGRRSTTHSARAMNKLHDRRDPAAHTRE